MLQFIRDQLDVIEEGIKQSWTSVLSAVRLLDYLACIASGRAISENLSSSDESVDELFTLFDDVRMAAVNTTDTILDFIGKATKILISFCFTICTSICPLQSGQ
jgi:cytochrome oxidase Cu insertion factor (SCO1/SenC/PrrC family)